ncbi:hypothetical protein VVYB158_07880 [Vibrio vulnificus CladeA-yb158]|uniref:GNAT family N-acetyltransferase n=1 Tax=Vibrio vulnificus TaxID=672 RepID=UPI00063DAA9C|nr:GNAT family N-acetyltransferase [Vibrio vulnificus]EGR7942936.1 GNAT family N-acetyltransferase [Vibrio vulnificus]EIV8493998.1 GNAT family N-acetyltransferase [Vibrio vulnificus]ELH4811191.1 GNAT family N-acetyltransferase [Vibrio vulnificus]ELV8667230.1 GNAT family N-acetyltransferase [Vibrio vulnificus]ELV8804766.1 GNAT family N-acetyltransferase [Vibrio vulnificus]
MIIIREAYVSDLPCLNGLYREQFIANYEDNEWRCCSSKRNSAQFWKENVCLSEARLKRNIADSNVCFMVAEKRNTRKLVGFLLASIRYPKKRLVVPLCVPAHYAYIERFYVSGDYHGLEIELMLLNRFYSWQKEYLFNRSKQGVQDED